MSISRKALCVAYGLIALLALVGTWGNNVAYLSLGFVGANTTFWQETLVNPASRSITVDLFFLGLAVFVWMVLEARRLRIGGVWIYVVLGLLIAISLFVPLFMIQRERKLAALQPDSSAGSVTAADVVGIALLGIVSMAYAITALSR